MIRDLLAWIESPEPVEPAAPVEPPVATGDPFAIGGRGYHEASLGRKFEIATKNVIPEVVHVQRELVHALHARPIDLPRAVRLLMEIEASVKPLSGRAPE